MYPNYTTRQSIKLWRITMTKTIVQVNNTPYTKNDFPSLESFYKHSLTNVVIFSIDGADWVEYGENTLEATDKAISANKRFLHHFLSQYGVDEIVLLEGCYDGRKEFSYAVSANLFYSFVQELGYVTEQHSYLVLKTPSRIESNAGVFGTNQAPRVILVDNDSGDTITTYSRVGLLSADLDTCLGWTYCNKSETYYELV
jgi:hypothetical protein